MREWCLASRKEHTFVCLYVPQPLCLGYEHVKVMLLLNSHSCQPVLLILKGFETSRLDLSCVLCVPMYVDSGPLIGLLPCIFDTFRSCNSDKTGSGSRQAR